MNVSLQHIPRDRFLILPSGRLRTDTATVYGEVLSFLGLSGTLQHQQESNEVNETQMDMAGNTVNSPPLTTTEVDAGGTTLEPEKIARAAVNKHFPSKHKYSRVDLLVFLGCGKSLSAITCFFYHFFIKS